MTAAEADPHDNDRCRHCGAQVIWDYSESPPVLTHLEPTTTDDHIDCREHNAMPTPTNDRRVTYNDAGQEVEKLLAMTAEGALTVEQFHGACEIVYGYRQKNPAIADLVRAVSEGRLPVAALIAATQS